jgi:hypothetical protein
VSLPRLQTILAVFPDRVKVGLRASGGLGVEQLSPLRNRAEGRVEIESEWTARKREREAGRLCRALELSDSSQNWA